MNSFNIKEELNKGLRLLTYFFCDNIWSFLSIMKLVFQGKREFNLFYYNAILKDRIVDSVEH